MLYLVGDSPTIQVCMSYVGGYWTSPGGRSIGRRTNGMIPPRSLDCTNMIIRGNNNMDFGYQVGKGGDRVFGWLG